MVLDPFAVAATQAGGYGAADSSSGSRLAMPIVDVPFSLVVVTRSLMDDIGANSYVDSLRFVSGMNAGSNVKNGGMVIRGLEVRGNSFSVVDGIDWGYESLQENEFIDRYEVVKGPAGTLYGDYSVGGLVNRIYKEPESVAKAFAKVNYSSFGRTTAVVDSTGPIPLVGKGQLEYRVVGVEAWGKEVTRYPDNRHGIYAALQFIPKGGQSKLWFHYSSEYWEYVTDDFDAIQDAAGGLSLNYGFSARESTLPGPTAEDSAQRYVEFGGTSTFETDSMGKWTSRLVARYVSNVKNADLRIQNIGTAYTFLGANGQSLGTIGAAPNPAGTPNPTFAGTPYKDIVLSSQLDYWNGPISFFTDSFNYDLIGAFDTGPLSHDLLIYSQVHYFWNRGRVTYLHMLPQYGGSVAGSNNFNPATAFSIVHPWTWAGAPNSLSDYAPFTLQSAYAAGDYTDTTTISTQYNAGIQDNIFLLDRRVLLVGGARYDYLNNQGVINNYTHTEGLGTAATNFVYKVSTVFKPFPNPGISFFANYTQTFTPEYGLLNPSFPGHNELFKNLVGLSKEVGVKAELFNSRLIGTFSYFHNQLQNNIIFILDQSTGRNINYQGGTANFPGYEGDLTWLINDNLSALVAVSDVNATQPNGAGFRNSEIGFSYRGILRYSLPCVKGLVAGVEIMHVPERYGSSAGFYNVAAYTELDAFTTYSIGQHWKLQANFNNITGVKAILSALGQLTNNVAVYPFNSYLSAQYNF